MPRTIDEDDWEDDDADDGDDDTIPCPHCKKQVYDGAEQCPHCGNYISEEDAPAEAKPGWIVVGAVICLAIVVLFWVWRG